MYPKLFAVAVLLVIVPLVSCNPVQKSTSPMELVSIFKMEEPCVRQGGLCLRIEDCVPDNLVQIRGVLCPSQMHLGVECCYLSLPLQQFKNTVKKRLIQKAHYTLEDYLEDKNVWI